MKVKDIKLFCLPYAGGSAVMYNSLEKYTNEIVEIIPLEYSGHGERISEEFYGNFNEMVSDVATTIIENITDAPFALLGYSMGSLVAYEVYYEVFRRTGKKPVHIFFAAHVAPEVREIQETSYYKSAQKLTNNLTKMGGTYQEVLNHEELIDLMVPIFYTDLKLYTQYEFMMKTEPISSNITIVYSDEENKNENIYEWSKHTSKFCRYYRIEGNHFFINVHTEEFVKIINKTLLTEMSLYSLEASLI